MRRNNLQSNTHQYAPPAFSYLFLEFYNHFNCQSKQLFLVLARKCLLSIKSAIKRAFKLLEMSFLDVLPCSTLKPFMNKNPIISYVEMAIKHKCVPDHVNEAFVAFLNVKN